MYDDAEPSTSSSNGTFCSDRIGSNNGVSSSTNVNQNNLTCLHNGSNSTTCVNSAFHNDCGKHCIGTKPRPKHLTCNIPNGSSSSNDCIRKVNNIMNGEGKYKPSSEEANLNTFDSYMRNNVDTQPTVEKCPSKVGSCVDDDSSSGNEDEECCIYTYKGDKIADLPSSFFKLNVSADREEPDRNSSPDMDYLEMDFDPGPSYGLDSEENSECSEVQLVNDQNISNSDLPMLLNSLIKLENPTNNLSSLQSCTNLGNGGPSCSKDFSHLQEDLNLNKSNNEIRLEDNQNFVENVKTNERGELLNDGAVTVNSKVEEPKETKESNSVSPSLSADALVCSSSSSSLSYRLSKHSVDLYSPGESWSDSIGELSPDSHQLNLNSALYHCVMTKRQVLDKQSSFVEPDLSNLNENGSESPDNSGPSIEQTMIWTEQEASRKQVTQIGVSACGATAVINAMMALGMNVFVEKIKAVVNTRNRADGSPLPEYLFSRSIAGASHVDIIRGLHQASNNAIFARFYHMFPQRNISVLPWLASWIKKGAVPILTLNLQAGGVGIEADWWHHQMVYGVGSRGVFLTNPLSCVNEATLLPQLSSPSVLLIRRSDIVSRWSPDTDLRPLADHPDPLWKKLNVLGQVVNVLREHGRNETFTQYISIPAIYQSGVTLAALRDSPAGQELLQSPDELPLLIKASFSTPSCQDQRNKMEVTLNYLRTLKNKTLESS